MEILLINKKTGKPIKLKQQTKDPSALRASIGGNKEHGYYVTFRGNMDDVQTMLEDTLTAFKLGNQKFKEQNN